MIPFFLFYFTHTKKERVPIFGHDGATPGVFFFFFLFILHSFFGRRGGRGRVEGGGRWGVCQEVEITETGICG